MHFAFPQFPRKLSKLIININHSPVFLYSICRGSSPCSCWAGTTCCTSASRSGRIWGWQRRWFAVRGERLEGWWRLGRGKCWFGNGKSSQVSWTTDQFTKTYRILGYSPSWFVVVIVLWLSTKFKLFLLMIDNDSRHAGYFTSEEVIRIMRDKLIRLQKLYIDQFQRLRYLLREERRAYRMALRREQVNHRLLEKGETFFSNSPGNARLRLSFVKQ